MHPQDFVHVAVNSIDMSVATMDTMVVCCLHFTRAIACRHSPMALGYGLPPCNNNSM